MLLQGLGLRSQGSILLHIHRQLIVSVGQREWITALALRPLWTGWYRILFLAR